MTTKPKAPRFHTRRRQYPEPSSNEGNVAHTSSGEANAVDEPVKSFEEEIAEIRAEGLTGRQLRMARRIAQRHGLSATSDYDAVRLLRGRGIDPFQRSNLLEMVVSDRPDTTPSTSTIARAYGPPSDFLPSTEVIADEARSRHIHKIQMDVARRRRGKLVGLMARLAAFVLLPTILVGYYFYTIATPMYATKSQFSVSQASPAGIEGSGWLSGTILATAKESIDIQDYLHSLGAMIALDQSLGYKIHFEHERIDFLNRLPPNASNAKAYKSYQDNVKVSFNATEGVLRMEVTAADPETSEAFSKMLIELAEHEIDSESLRMREDQMQGARSSFEEAEDKMRAAQQQVIALQEQYNVISADVEVNLLTSRIAGLETQLTQDQLTLDEMLANPSPNMARVEPVQRRIEALEATIADLRSQLTIGNQEDLSLARIGSELQVAQVELETRRLLMQEALSQMETARIEANRQTRYLTTGVTPIAPDEPTYPRAFENTLVAFLIFCGIYLMISLTVSILREQVSS